MSRPKHLLVENRVKETGNFSLGRLVDKEIINKYNQDIPTTKIAEENQTSQSHIYDVLHFNNIELKPRSSWNKGKSQYSVVRESQENGIEKRKLARLKIIEYFGNVCNKCGNNDVRVLQINHINGQSQFYKENSGDYLIRWEDKNFKDIEVLCSNCNILYEYERGNKKVEYIDSSIEPEVFIIGQTKINWKGVQEFLEHLGVENWDSDAKSDIEYLIELYGRMCYMSFGTSINPNLTRTRNSNKEYITNIINKGDGSILEHGSVNFIFRNVSRVFTAELCRHRVGTAISEQSLRFVRLTDMNYYLPTCIRESEEEIEIFTSTFQELSNLQKIMAELSDLDNQSFEKKKEITSAMRRVAPLGLSTNIGWSANLRTLRHVIEMRTSPWAEEEIRLVFAKVGKICQEEFPNLFSDYEVEEINGINWFKTENRKV